MLCLWEDFGEELRHNIIASVMKEFVTQGKRETINLQKKNKVHQSES